MRRSTASMAVLVLLAGLASCDPPQHGTSVSFGPPALVLDDETPERWFRVRLCYRGDAGDYPFAILNFDVTSPTPMRATIFVDAEYNETEIITATAGSESFAFWEPDEIDDACGTGVIVGFARIEPDEPVPDPSFDPVTIDWLISASISSSEEGADSLDLEVYVEALD